MGSLPCSSYGVTPLLFLRPQLWTLENNGGRVFGCIPGHYMWTFDDPLYRLLVLRGICWTVRQPHIDRLSELTTVGARIAP